MIPGQLVIPSHHHEGLIRKVAASQTVLLSSFSITSGREQTTAIVNEAEGCGTVQHNHIIKTYVRSVTHKQISKIIRAGMIE